MRRLAQCGTYAGYQRHKRHGEEPCEACTMANRDYVRRYRAFHPDARESGRWTVRVRHRAMYRLAAEFPGRFEELLAEERESERDPRLA